MQSIIIPLCMNASYQNDNYQQYSNSTDQIRGILSIMSAMFNMTFEESWIVGLLNLFKSKQQILNFFNCFHQAANFTIKDTQMELEHENNDCDIFSTCGIDFSCLDMPEYKIQSNMDSWPAIENNYEKHALQNEIKQQIKIQPHLSCSDRLIALQNIILQHPYLLFEQIASKFRYAVKEQVLSSQQLQNLIKTLNFCQKKLMKTSIERNSLQNLQNRYKYCLQYYRLRKTESKIFFLDGCKFDMNLCPEFIWAKTCQPVIQKIDQTYLQLFIGLSEDGRVFWQNCKRFKNDGANEFINIANIFDRIGQNNKEQSIVIIANNCNVTISKELKKLFIKNKWRLFILPPLSPQLNPISMLFKEVKTKIRQSSAIYNLDQLAQTINSICNCISNFQEYFDIMNAHIIKGLTKSLY